MTVESIKTACAQVSPQVVDLLKELIRIPSISADSFDQSQMTRSAEYVAARFAELGCAAEVVTATDPATGKTSRPAILAEKIVDPALPTVLLYAHHDVQPAGDPAKWTTPAFEPTERNGRLYGRGSADDGAGIVTHWGTLAAFGNDLPVNVRIFIEGEEEVGSPCFRPFLEQYRDRLSADVIIVADSGNWEVGQPALTSSLRGVIDCEVTLKVMENSVHSGFFGGPILDAPTLMCRLIATLHDAAGSPAVPGLKAAYDSEVDYPEADFRAQAHVVPGYQLAGKGSIASRLWSQPAISLLAMDITPVDQASNSLIPSVRAKISMRIAPGQDPAAAMAALTAHLRANAPFGAELEIKEGEMGPTYAADLDSTPTRLAREALSEGFGHPCVAIGQGGSIPFISDFTEVFPGAEVLVTGMEDPHAGAHAPNESMDLSDLKKTVLSEALLLAKLAEAR